MHSPYTQRGLAVLVFTVAVGALRLLQGTPYAVLPHSADGFLAGLAIGLAVMFVVWVALAAFRKRGGVVGQGRPSDA